MRDIRHGIDEVVGPVAPFTVDIDQLVHRERRRKRRLALATGGGTAMAMVALVGIGATMLQPGGAPPAAEDITTNSPAVATLDDLPPLEDVDYLWVDAEPREGDGEVDEAYTEAFFSHFEAHWPEAEIDTTDYHVAGEPEYDLARPPAMEWTTYGLTPWDLNVPDSEAIYERQVLQLSMALDDPDEEGLVSASFSGIQYDFGDGWVNMIIVDVLPAGSFTVGDRTAYDPIGCDPQFELQNPCTSVDEGELEAPDGTAAYFATVEYANGESGQVTDLVLRVMLVREDGSAVVVGNSVYGPHPGQDDTTVEGAEAPLTVEDLLGIAEALPGEFP